MAKTHYQAPWVEKKEESRAMCNDILDNPLTSTDANDVDCKRCLKMIESWGARGMPIRRGKGVASGVLHSIKTAIFDRKA